MKKILIYKDKGADAFCTSSLVFALKHEKVDEAYTIAWIDRELLRTTEWQKETKLVIFPGGRDIPYHQALKGEGNKQIKDFVLQGGKFLGICAGGYFGSAKVEFEKGGPLEVNAERELQFFPGVAQGPAYGLGKFRYHGQNGAQIAKLDDDSGSSLAAYFNGGCAFLEAEKYEGISVMSRYADIESRPPAVIKCQVGKGCAILSGVHPEYSSHFEFSSKYIDESLLSALHAIECKRRHLFLNILSQLALM